MLGHHDRFTFQTAGSPWNQAHPSQGCGQEQLVATGRCGLGLLLCGRLLTEKTRRIRLKNATTVLVHHSIGGVPVERYGVRDDERTRE